MSRLELIALFEKHKEEEYKKFEKVKNKLSNRRDLCGLLLLDRLVPGERNILHECFRDIIYLSIDLHELSKAATEEDVISLLQCGLFYESVYPHTEDQDFIAMTTDL